MLSHPHLPMPLEQKSIKSYPNPRTGQRSIILVQITGPNQVQQHLLVMMVCIRRPECHPLHQVMCEKRVPL